MMTFASGRKIVSEMKATIAWSPGGFFVRLEKAGNQITRIAHYTRTVPNRPLIRALKECGG